jgi:FKBP-type peptidyl-prolyl cis-trans isomerase SlyD
MSIEGKELDMKKAQVVSFNCVLKNQLGQLISYTVNYDVLTVPHAREGQQWLAGLNEGLRDLKEGEKRSISVSAERAFGFYDPEKVRVCPRQALDKNDVKVGDKVVGQVEGKKTSFRVIDVRGDDVVLDANHPLAGQDLVFEIEALGVRDATTDEISEAESSSTSSPLYH